MLILSLLISLAAQATPIEPAGDASESCISLRAEAIEALPRICRQYPLEHALINDWLTSTDALYSCGYPKLARAVEDALREKIDGEEAACTQIANDLPSQI